MNYLLKADAEFFSRIDAVAGKGKRAEWIRAACEMRLGSVPEVTVGPKPAVREERAKRPERKVLPAAARKDADRWAEQKPVLLAKLRERPMDERTAARELGWNEGLVSRVATELSQGGEIRFERGLMIA